MRAVRVDCEQNAPDCYNFIVSLFLGVQLLLSEILDLLPSPLLPSHPSFAILDVLLSSQTICFG